MTPSPHAWCRTQCQRLVPAARTQCRSLMSNARTQCGSLIPSALQYGTTKGSQWSCLSCAGRPPSYTEIWPSGDRGVDSKDRWERVTAISSPSSGCQGHATQLVITITTTASNKMPPGAVVSQAAGADGQDQGPGQA